MAEVSVAEVLGPKLAQLPGVVAVTLGGSRARGTERPNSDWDFGLYYRGEFDASVLADLGYQGHFAQPGEWGRIVNGGAWLSVDGQPVDVLLRDLDQIEQWWEDAHAGGFEIDNVEGHLAGLPTYTPIGEIAVGKLLAGKLPEVDYPEALRDIAGRRWRWNAAFSLLFAGQYAERDEATMATGMMARAIVQTAHAVMAERARWVLNEKGLVAEAGLGAANDILGAGTLAPSAALIALRELLDPPVIEELATHAQA